MTRPRRDCRPLLWRLKRHAFMREQPSLAFKAAAIFDQRAVGADQAMAGQHNADRVGTVGMADRAHRAGPVELRGQRAITHGAAGWNFWQRAPDLALERRAGDAPFDRIQTIEIAFEISRECPSN